jgi:hypothetical protein
MAGIIWLKKMDFNIQEVPVNIIKRMQQLGIWAADCPVLIEKLRLLHIMHYNFAGKKLQGEIIVHERVASDILKIFTELMQVKFPIQSVKLIDEFHGSDELSMNSNNSSCFNFRKIDGSAQISNHSYGLAIDINPVQNPCIITNDGFDKKIMPQPGENFLNRGDVRAGMVESVVEIFNRNGFSDWGGKWNNPIDYHHFQVPKSKIAEYIA